MSSPFDAGRDSNAGGFDFGTQSDIPDEHVSAFRDSFQPSADRLNEDDYRDSDFGGGGEASPTPDRQAAQNPQRFTYPTRAPGGGLGF
jgi:hypothetical protein